MASSHFDSLLSEEPIAAFEKTLLPSTEHGADLRFHGVVRDREEGRVITGIRYTHYESMAQRELEKIGAELAAEWPEHRAMIFHRIGFVAIGEASLLIRVQTKHSAEAFLICQEYVKRIKATVPIWKEVVFAEG
jgi:molybdopterin synthase catalytic subunit